MRKGYLRHPLQKKKHQWQFYHTKPARQLEMKMSKHPLQVIIHNQLDYESE